MISEKVQESRMGGYGSGRSCSRNTTSAFLRLDVRKLHLEGCSVVSWSREGQVFAAIRLRSEPGRIVLSYRHSDDGGQNWKNKEYAVRLSVTRCNYGGNRVWFLCPAQGCGRRVAVLYGPPVFACRQCHQLVYDSQRMQRYERALAKAQAIRMKLGGSANMTEFFPLKPKRMHNRTYQRLRSEAEAADEMSWPPSLKALLQRT